MSLSVNKLPVKMVDGKPWRPRIFTGRLVDKLVREKGGKVGIRKEGDKRLNLFQAAKRIGIKTGEVENLGAKLAEFGILKDSIDLSKMSNIFESWRLASSADHIPPLVRKISLRKGETRTPENVFSAIVWRLAEEKDVLELFNIVTALKERKLHNAENPYLLAGWVKQVLPLYAFHAGQLTEWVVKGAYGDNISFDDGGRLLAEVVPLLYGDDSYSLMKFVSGAVKEGYPADIFSQGKLAIQAGIWSGCDFSSRPEFVGEIAEKKFPYDTFFRAKFIAGAIQESYSSGELYSRVEFAIKATEDKKVIIRVASELYGKEREQIIDFLNLAADFCNMESGGLIFELFEEK